ncbi:distal tail protein Dit [Bacillus pseudomycoides]|uniref:distal tail protein Dit n=1 Tax=Bacillus pseudomycoides TaxID=64104 RepID=UPI000BEF3A96|nr:distal tail protein Dit [Bacillus pseudomycoides]PEN09666.1 phage tail protein [Bacillus pseudomycoides]
MSSFTFNNQRKKFIQIEKGWKRPTWAPLRRNLIQVPNYPGARLLSTETDIRVLPIPVGIIVPDGSDLEKLKEEIADWLITEQSVELIFDAEPDRIYMAVVDESFDPEEFVTLGKGVIKFICPMPYKLSKDKKKYTMINQNSTFKADVENKGTVEASPLITLTAARESTFFDIDTDDGQFFRIGYPATVEEKPFIREELIADLPMTTIGWTTANYVDYGNVAGSFENSGEGPLQAEDYGTGTGWHGPALKRSLKVPIQNFRVEVDLDFQMTSYEIGRMEVYLLDEASEIIGKIAIWRNQLGTSYTWVDIHAGNKNNMVQIIGSHGTYENTWDLFSGVLRIVRVNQRWEAYIARVDEKGKHDSAMFRVFNDIEDRFNQSKLAQIVIHSATFGDIGTKRQSFNQLRVWRYNDPADFNVPYIITPGDKIEIDCEKSDIRVNGESRLFLKDFSSDFLRLQKGKTKVSAYPRDIGKVDVEFRERYR